MGNEVAKLPKKDLISQVEFKLEEMLKDRIEACPKGFNKERFIQNCVAVLQDTKDIEKCTPISIVRTLAKGAYLGLDFFQRECYGIPYAGVLNFQTDYKGEIKLARRYGRGVRDIYAKEVREGDVLTLGIEKGEQTLSFSPLPFNNAEVVGVFAVVLFTDGTMRYETMSKEEVEKTRKDYSKAKNSGAWINSWGEMAKKTILRRLCKLLDIDFDNRDQQKAYEEGGDADFTKKVAAEKSNPVKVPNPFKPEEEKEPEGPVDAEIVKEDPDSSIREDLKKRYPEADEDQIEILVREEKGDFS